MNKPCLDCGRPSPNSRCPECQAPVTQRMNLARTQRRGSTDSRGYGSQHQRLRASYARLVDAGAYPCWRCGNVIMPGTPWDLGHNDEDRSKYRGPEHESCNRGSNTRSVF